MTIIPCSLQHLLSLLNLLCLHWLQLCNIPHATGSSASVFHSMFPCWHCYTMTYNNGGSSASYTSTMGDCLSSDGSTSQLLTVDSWLSGLNWLVFWFSSIASSGTHKKCHFPQFLYSWMRNCCYTYLVSSVPWPTNGHLFWLSCSDSQKTPHIIIIHYTNIKFQ